MPDDDQAPAPPAGAPATVQASHWLRRAELLARLHRVADARSACELARSWIADDRTRLGDDPRWRVDLARVEATLIFYGGEFARALPVVLAARAEAEVHGLADLSAECAGIAALFSLHCGHIDEALMLAVQALRTAPAAAHRTHYFGCLALADLCDEAGVAPEAHKLYRQAVGAARAANDHRATGATITRMACNQSARALQAHLEGELDGEQLKQAIVGARSTISWAEGAGMSPNPFVYIQLSDLLLVSGQIAEAESLSQTWRDLTHEPLLSSAATATLAHCLVLRGAMAAAQELVDAALQLLPAQLEDRELVWRARVLRNAADVYVRLGHPGSMQMNQEAEAAKQVLSERQRLARTRLQHWLAEAPVASLLQS